MTKEKSWLSSLGDFLAGLSAFAIFLYVFAILGYIILTLTGVKSKGGAILFAAVLLFIGAIVADDSELANQFIIYGSIMAAFPFVYHLLFGPEIWDPMFQKWYKS